MFRLRTTLSDSMRRVEKRIQFLRESCDDEAVKYDPTFSEDWRTVSGDMQSVGASLLLVGRAVLEAVMDIHAQMSLQAPTPQDLEKEEELLQTLRALEAAFDAYATFPVARWHAGTLSTFYQKHQTALLLGGVGGAACAGLVGWALLPRLLPLCCEGLGFVSAQVALMLLGAIGGLALTGLLIWGVTRTQLNCMQTREQKELEDMQRRLAKLRDGPAPSLQNIREMRLRLAGYITDIIDAQGQLCWICHETLTNCTAHQPQAHLDTCAVFPFACSHPVCHACASKWGECGLCKAGPRPPPLRYRLIEPPPQHSL